MVWDLGEGKLHHRPLKATQKLFYDISLVISMVTGEGWGLGGVLLSFPRLCLPAADDCPGPAGIPHRVPGVWEKSR